MAQCRRCNGLIVFEGRLADVPVRLPADVDAVSALADEGACWRCVNCGDRTDAVVEANRRALVPPATWQAWQAGGRQPAGYQVVPEARCAGLPPVVGWSALEEL